MIPSARPINNIHVSAFDGSRSLGSRWVTHASDFRFLQKRSQIPSGTPTVQYILPPRPRNGQQRASLRQYQHCLSALFRRLAISPVRTSVGPFTPPLYRRHRTAMLSLRRAPHPLLLMARAPHSPLFLPPPLPLSLRPRAASARFFAPPSPPTRTSCQSRCSYVRFFPPWVPRPSPSSPPAPAGVLTHLSFIF